MPFTVQWMEEWIKPSPFNQPWPLLDPSQYGIKPQPLAIKSGSVFPAFLLFLFMTSDAMEFQRQDLFVKYFLEFTG